MKRNKFIASAFIATFLLGTAQVMAADKQQNMDKLKLECNECESLSGESEAIRDQIRDQSHDHDASGDGTKAKKRHRYQHNKNHSYEGASSVGDSSNSVGVAGKKVRRR